MSADRDVLVEAMAIARHEHRRRLTPLVVSFGWYDLDPEDQAAMMNEDRAALAAVAPLIRRVALEDAAKYHDEAADGERDLASQCGAQNDRRGNELHKYLEQEHILSAAAIRALD